MAPPDGRVYGRAHAATLFVSCRNATHAIFPLALCRLLLAHNRMDESATN